MLLPQYDIEVDCAENGQIGLEKVKQHESGYYDAVLILRCLDEGLYPSWDAQNMNSVHLAEKLGYEFDHEYTAYEVTD